MHSILRGVFFPMVVISVIFSPPVMAHGHGDETPLTKTMEKSSKALKLLRKIDRADWAGGAKAARDAAEGCRKGMAYIPALIKDMKEGKKKTLAIADYKRLMGLSYAALSELELAYLGEDQAKVDAAMKKVKAGKKEGHKKYTDD